MGGGRVGVGQQAGQNGSVTVPRLSVRNGHPSVTERDHLRGLRLPRTPNARTMATPGQITRGRYSLR
jgi:hypothetical protein